MYMKKLSHCLILLFAINTLIPACFSQAIYHWVDENGKHHFSDQNPKTGISEEFNQHEIPSIKTVKSKPTVKLKTKKRKAKKTKRVARESKTERCNQLKADIASIQSKLKTRLLADKSDQYSKKLSDLRWKKLKTC